MRVRNSFTRSVPAQCVEPIDDDVAEAAGDQLDAAQDERPHQDLAQLGVGLDEREQLLAIELDHFARLADAQARQRPAAGDHVAFAGELPGTVRDDERLGGAGGRKHLKLAADRRRRTARLWSPTSTSTSPRATARRRPWPAIRHLRGRERRKQAIGLPRDSPTEADFGTDGVHRLTMSQKRRGSPGRCRNGGRRLSDLSRMPRLVRPDERDPAVQVRGAKDGITCNHVAERQPVAGDDHVTNFPASDLIRGQRLGEAYSGRWPCSFWSVYARRPVDHDRDVRRIDNRTGVVLLTETGTLRVPQCPFHHVRHSRLDDCEVLHHLADRRSVRRRPTLPFALRHGVHRPMKGDVIRVQKRERFLYSRMHPYILSRAGIHHEAREAHEGFQFTAFMVFMTFAVTAPETGACLG